jgi:hypothetical protein
MERDESVVDMQHDPQVTGGLDSSGCSKRAVQRSVPPGRGSVQGRCGAGLVMTVTMPSVEVGTVGGGTSLPAQSAALELLGLRGSSDSPGEHAGKLARVVAGTVLAGELSLMSALTSNDLLSAHIKLNRKVEGGGGGGGAGSSPVVTPMQLALLHELGVPPTAAAAAAGAAAGADSPKV